MHLQCFLSMRYVRGWAMGANQSDDHYPLWAKLMYRLPAGIMWLYYESSSTMWFSDNYFFCLVCGLLEKKNLRLQYICNLQWAESWGSLTVLENIST